MDWKLHKKVYLEEFDSLDPEIRAAILRNPNGEEAEHFNDFIKKHIERLGNENKHTN